MTEHISYARLSKDDGSRYSSIKQQHDINTRYIKETLEWNGEIHYFSDDNVSGFFFDRPDLKKAIELIEKNNGKAILVTCESSRFGRNESEVLSTWDNLYEIGTRIIFISENIDSYLNPNIRDMLGIYAWKDEQHVRAASKSVTAKFRERQLKGDLVIKVPYGYKMKTEEIKDTKNRTLGKDFIIKIDEEVDYVVKEIFDMYIDGYGYRKIANVLNEKSYPNPSLYAGREDATDTWSNQSIRGILTNDFYIGTLTCKKTFKRSVKGKSYITPKDETIKHENNHEALIDKKTFDMVQRIIENRRNTEHRGTKGAYTHLLSGKIFCGKCHKTFICSKCYKDSSTKINKTSRYICGTKFRHGTSCCSNMNMKESDILELLNRFINRKINENKVALERLRNKKWKQENDKENLDKKINRINNEINRIKIDIKNTIRNKLKAEREGKVIVAESYDEELNNLESKINKLEIELTKVNEFKNSSYSQEDILMKQNKFLEEFLNKELTKKDIEILIDKITINDEAEDIITFEFNDPTQ